MLEGFTGFVRRRAWVIAVILAVGLIADLLVINQRPQDIPNWLIMLYLPVLLFLPVYMVLNGIVDSFLVFAGVMVMGALLYHAVILLALAFVVYRVSGSR
jgi:hypothetical protein